MKPERLSLISEGDVLISASPSFMFEGIRGRLRGAEILSTEVDLKNAGIVRLCYGENKITEFRRAHEGLIPENYYTDNFNDMPMIKFAKKAWLVDGIKIKEIKL